jgi:hypothetical protein
MFVAVWKSDMNRRRPVFFRAALQQRFPGHSLCWPTWLRKLTLLGRPLELGTVLTDGLKHDEFRLAYSLSL